MLALIREPQQFWEDTSLPPKKLPPVVDTPGFYWARWDISLPGNTPKAATEVVYVHANGYAYRIAHSNPYHLNCFDFLSKLERPE